MANDYAVAYGALEGAVIGIAIELQHDTSSIDGKAVAKKLRDAIVRAETRGEIQSVDELLAEQRSIGNGK